MEPLSLIEARVLGVLIEKEDVLPGHYPLTLKAVLRACNQKTDRNPIMHVLEADVLTALKSLNAAGLTVEHTAKFVTRYAHNVVKEFHIAKQAVPLLGILLLRGPLTPSEMRLIVDRVHKFENVSTVAGFLVHMSRDRDEPLVAPLPRKQGKREVRWAQLLTGPVEKTEREEMSIIELMEMAFDLQRRIRILEDDALV